MKRIIGFLLLGLIFASCASCNKIEKETSTKDNNNKVIKKHVSPKLAVGTVLIEATILEIENSAKSFNINVNKVIGSGGSTPTLAVGEEITVTSKIELSKDQLSKNDRIKLLLKSYKQRDESATSNIWKIIGIK